MKLRLPTALLAIAVIMTAATAGAAPAPWSGQENTAFTSAGSLAKLTRDTPMYIVQLDGEPAAAYVGGTTGFAATSPIATGATRLDSNAPATVAYVSLLEAKQDEFSAALDSELRRDVKVMFNYHYVLNGVAVVMSADEAALVEDMPGVKSVSVNGSFPPATDAGPAWIGAPGIWNGSAVPGGIGSRGEGIVVGVLDTGINMDHPSFAAIGDDGYEHTNPLGDGNYLGWCNPEHPNYSAQYQCNAKLIGAWSYTNDMTPEDLEGHGSHTASTAAGNFITASFVAPTMLITTALQGVAPHANIIAYDVCSEAQSCTFVAAAAALDQVVDDGVDVINYSIGTPNGSIWYDSNVIITAFRNLRAAGISAAVSAGNSGPGLGTTAAIAPWMTTVGASTHNRTSRNQLVDMAGGDMPPPADIDGMALTVGYGPAPIVLAAGRMNANGQPDDGRCLEPFPAGTFDGEIVVCDRGTISRTDKGANVLAGGAGGLVLANMAQHFDLGGDAHELPAIHITYDDAVVLKEWMSTGTGHMARITDAVLGRDPTRADVMAGFSSRGPAITNTCCIRPWGLGGQRLLDVVKPDVDAPGVDIWAATMTDQDDPSPNPEFESLQGTSMSSPHVAGAIALMHALYPDWTPAQVQSALMLTGVTEGVRKENGTTPATPFEFGGGRVDLAAAASTGLVMDMTVAEAMAANPDLGGDPAALNLATMANFQCSGLCSWVRTVESVWDEEVTWELSAVGTEPLGLSVTPSSLTIAPGQKGTFTVTADTSAVELDTFAFGKVDLDPSSAGPSHAHVNVAVQSQSIELPSGVQSTIPPLAVGYTSVVSGTWTIAGFQSVSVPALAVTAVGFSVPDQVDTQLPADPTNDNPFDLAGGTLTTIMAVPEGALRVVAETKSSTAVDIDMFLGMDLNGDGAAEEAEMVCASTGATWQEYCDIRNPAAGNWWVLIQNWDPSAPGATDDITFFHGVVAAGGTTMSIMAPESVEAGVPWDLEIGWDLDSISPGDVFYGVAMLGTGSGEPDDVLNLAFDLIGVEAPGSIYLPDVRNKFVAGETP